MGEKPTRGMVGRWVAGAVAVVLLLGAGAVAGVFWSERRAAAPPEAASPSSRPAPGAHAGHGGGAPATGAGASTSNDEPVEVSLTAAAAQRAGIRLTPVKSAVVSTGVTVPGTVTSNAYRDTKVNALVGGIVREVRVELGADVRRGQALAVIFSNDLAEAQMRYLSLRAMLQADEQKLARTQNLTEIGAASRQELEEVTAVHSARATEVAAAAQRLQLLGLGRSQIERLTEPSQIVSEVTVAAPADGAVIARSLNVGQVVAAGQELFVVTDLSTVWVIGDLYEKDFAAVRVGTSAAVRVPTSEASAIRGRVAYIDPRVDPATRTAKVRVEVPNRGELRLGMFTEVTFEASSAATRLVIPRAAVQAIGQRNVVYVATEDEGRFQERTVRLGAAAGDTVEVLEGLSAGERVVSEGSFFLRAEAGRARNSG
jgi:membrane fusion protein, heavy metal efflux system